MLTREFILLKASRLIGVFAGFIAAGLLLSSCSGGAQTKDGVRLNTQQDNKQALASPISQQGKQKETADTGVNETVRMAIFEGTLQATHRDRRQVTILLDDGKQVRVKVGKGGGDFTSLKPGNRVSFKLHESVEIVQDTSFHPETGHIVERFPPGSMAERELYNSYYNRPPTGHHAVNGSEIIEVPAKVASVDPNSRTISLVTYDHRHFTVHVSDTRVDLSGLETGEPVVARFREVDELDVIHSP
ncbi:MAG TPA: hypothetical protein VLU73_19330 [Methylococcaceae bacterium]|nr:hypothetical protein [Methylococcaceae bacterium]